MYEYSAILFKAFISFLFLFLMTRMMGKKQIAQLTFFDYVVGITIGNFAASMAIDPQVSLVDGFLTILVWSFMPILISRVSIRSHFLRQVFEGTPTILIQEGKIREEGLKRENLTIENLMQLLRTRSIFKLSDVEFAVMESSGELNVLKKSELQPVTPKQMGLLTPNEREPRILTINGVVFEDTLRAMGRSKEWLIQEMNNQGIKDIRNVLVAQLESDGKIYIDYKT